MHLPSATALPEASRMRRRARKMTSSEPSIPQLTDDGVALAIPRCSLPLQARAGPLTPPLQIMQDDVAADIIKIGGLCTNKVHTRLSAEEFDTLSI